MASFSASVAPVSLSAIVPLSECRMPQVTVSSVTARPEVLTVAVAGPAARAGAGQHRCGRQDSGAGQQVTALQAGFLVAWGVFHRDGLRDRVGGTATCCPHTVPRSMLHCGNTSNDVIAVRAIEC